MVLVTLTACSPNASNVSKNTETNYGEYTNTVNDLKSLFDGQAKNQFTVQLEKGVADPNFPNGHTVIRVGWPSGKLSRDMEIIKKTVDSNTAKDDSPKLFMQGLQKMISEEAKKLPDNTTEIVLSFENTQMQQVPIAASTKTRDIIPIIQ